MTGKERRSRRPESARRWKKLIFSAALFIFLPPLAAKEAAPAPTAGIPAQLKGAKALKDIDHALREQMMVMSRQLGVDCTTCHNTKNFAAADKPEFRVARAHMKITQLLIDNGFDGRDKRPKADCYLCHRGQLKPDYIEKFDPMTMEKIKK